MKNLTADKRSGKQIRRLVILKFAYFVLGSMSMAFFSLWVFNAQSIKRPELKVRGLVEYRTLSNKDFKQMRNHVVHT